MGFNFQTDEDTERLLTIVVHFLQEYFGYDETQAFDMVNRYYNTAQIDDDDYHHLGPWAVAVLIHYVIGLQGNGRKFAQWRKNNKLLSAPEEAAEYAHEHYYKRGE